MLKPSLLFGVLACSVHHKEPIIIENHYDNDFTMRFTITNQQNHWVKVHKPNTLLETHCPKYIKVILNQKLKNKNQKEIPYDGLLMLRMEIMDR